MSAMLRYRKNTKLLITETEKKKAETNTQ